MISRMQTSVCASVWGGGADPAASFATRLLNHICKCWGQSGAGKSRIPNHVSARGSEGVQGGAWTPTMSMRALGKATSERGKRQAWSVSRGFPHSSSAILTSGDPCPKFRQRCPLGMPGQAPPTAHALWMRGGDVMGMATVTSTIRGTATAMGSQ